jgi:hypothetical protein
VFAGEPVKLKLRDSGLLVELATLVSAGADPVNTTALEPATLVSGGDPVGITPVGEGMLRLQGPAPVTQTQSPRASEQQLERQTSMSVRLPSTLLRAIAKNLRLFSSLSSVGKVPVNRLSARLRCWSLTKLPISVGTEPSKEFWTKDLNE